MRALRICGFVAFVAITLIALHGMLPAQKKGKPGGGNVPGTVYFAWSDWDDPSPGWFTYVMDANGNQQGHLPVSSEAVNLEPSDALHVDTGDNDKAKRWFLYLKENALYPGKNELWAISDDAMHERRLTSESDGIFATHATRRWTVDRFVENPAADTYVSYVGKKGTPPVRNIYGLRITWTAGVPAGFGDSLPLLDPGRDIPAGTTVGDFDWAPDSLRLVYNAGQLRIMDWTVTPISYPLTSGTRPEWAPLGGRIAFELYDGVSRIASVNPDPNNLDLQILASGNSSHHSSHLTQVKYPKWAPTGTHLVYQLSASGLTSNKDPHIYRMDANGGNKTSLTKSLNTDFRARPIPLGWR